MSVIEWIRGAACGVVLVGLCAGGIACTERQLNAINDGGAQGGGADGPVAEWQIIPALGEHKVDILFMVDNSLSMAPLQAKLNAGFPTFIQTLQALPAGPPDMHIAVISSDTGAGKYDLATYGCRFEGNRGSFQFQPTGLCAQPSLLPSQTFLQVVNGVPSYTGSLVDAFTCIAALGDRGCGFEGPFKSVRWALDPVLARNPGFLRSDANLAVVLVTNEDDCSVPDDSDLADPVQTSISDPLGTFNSFRCNEFGHLCNINGALRPPPREAAENLQGCISNETPSGRLTKVAEEVAFLTGLKGNPNQITVAAITGPATPYGMELVEQGSDFEQHPIMKHSCALTTGEYADPAVRIQQWVNAFGSNGLLLPICADSMAPQLQTIAEQIGRSVGTMCVSGPFPYSGGFTQPDCRLIDRFSNATDGSAGQVILNCIDAGADAPCWTVADDPTCSGGSKLLTIDRKGTMPPANFGTAFTCEPCPTD